MSFRYTMDKFGRSLNDHYSHTRQLHHDGPLLLASDDSHYDVGDKHLRAVADPQEDQDSVNKRYLERMYVPRTLFDPLFNRVNDLVAIVSQISAAQGDVLHKHTGGKAWDAKGLKFVNVGSKKQTFG